MPRRNHGPSPYTRHAPPQDEPLSYDEMALALVDAGIRTAVILDKPPLRCRDRRSGDWTERLAARMAGRVGAR